ncbi:MAG: hypothetical protein N2Z62_05975 [Rhodobacteraceae bacterium]|nr:hypothetical protein [Paracoccaceae bacterium]
MRDFFISAFEKLVGVIVVVLLLLVVLAAVAAMTGGMTGPDGQQVGGIGAALAILILGFVYVIFIGGAMYLGLGIYQNTRRTAELLERMAPR